MGQGSSQSRLTTGIILFLQKHSPCLMYFFKPRTHVVGLLVYLQALPLNLDALVGEGLPNCIRFQLFCGLILYSPLQ